MAFAVRPGVTEFVLAPNLIRGGASGGDPRIIGALCDEPLPPASKMCREVMIAHFLYVML